MNFTDFYNINDDSGNRWFGGGGSGGPSLTPAVQRFPDSYPYGPIYPNIAAVYASVPGKVDLQFRPFM
jgi:hypothetical protein